MNCSECKFWKETDDKFPPVYGQCRRRAPRAAEIRFPPTHSYDWCGEWRKRNEGNSIKVTQLTLKFYDEPDMAE